MPLPTSLHDCTAFMTNLPEFLTDSQLQSTLKASMKAISAPPLQISRALDTSSLKYGFIIFQSQSQRDDFIAEHDGKELEDTQSKTVFTFSVEKFGEKGGKTAKVPAQLIDFVLGTDQRGIPRRTHLRQQASSSQSSQSTQDAESPEAKAFRQGGCADMPGRISRDDVTRLSLGQPSKVRGRGSRGVPHRLNSSESGEFARSIRRGYLRLEGTGYRRGRKGSPLSNTHRQFCDSRCVPQVVMMKGSGGRTVDNVLVDLSPLRDIGGPKRRAADEVVRRAAEEAGMELCKHEEGAGADPGYDPMDDGGADFANDPIWKLPSIVSVGVFEGTRGAAQAMCKAVVEGLSIGREDVQANSKRTVYGERGGGGPKNRRDAGAKGGGRTKNKKNKRRERGGGRSTEDSIRGLF
ncbi:hypothetical protein TrRE_jg10819 [Triparma retinervis]|uniref:RRM domain-containing protein n=1 Tax=Triparma retinervis TaxID=2557542 RepID=A0A9W6ZII0_9STRA|nr:hypothetical protein TrRE_jg10819 [Triparma retinervis]